MHGLSYSTKRRANVVPLTDTRKPSPDLGLIFNIQRFSIHDGPGIRTTVFMKGCPLRCRWCSNPESWHAHREIVTNDLRCTKCGKCQEVCPQTAIAVDKKGRRIDRSRCDLCLKCAEVCPTGSIAISGAYMTINQVAEEVARDRLFYQNSGGGMTVSGGEPLSQWEFVSGLLGECRNRGIHTALDTSGYAPWEVLEKVLGHADLVLFDIKHMDAEQHRKGTGKSNRLILANARRTASKARTWVRVPLIPGYNDSEGHLEEVARFALEIGAEKVSLLPYHIWGKAKYARLGRRYTIEKTPLPSDEFIERCQGIVESHGAKATVGR
jgi:pyruvate formate lyase activating enzyme